MDNKIEMYCLTHKRVNFLEELSYNLVNISSKPISPKYLNCDTQGNIINKEKYTRFSMDFRIQKKKNFKPSNKSSPKNKIKC